MSSRVVSYIVGPAVDDGSENSDQWENEATYRVNGRLEHRFNDTLSG